MSSRLKDKQLMNCGSIFSSFQHKAKWDFRIILMQINHNYQMVHFSLFDIFFLPFILFMTELSNTAAISQNPTSLRDGHNFYRSLIKTEKKKYVMIQSMFCWNKRLSESLTNTARQEKHWARSGCSSQCAGGSEGKIYYTVCSHCWLLPISFLPRSGGE